MITNNSKRKKAILFDFGDTLASTVPSYPERIRLAIERSGYTAQEDKYINAYIKADYETFCRFRKYRSVKNSDRVAWMFEILAAELDIPAGHEELRQQVKDNMKHTGFTNRVLMDNASATLEALRQKGFRLAIVSNNDGKVDQKCNDLRIKDYFEVITDSGRIGHIKPGSEIFRHTLEQLGLTNPEVLHIGDLYGADVLGANYAGIEAVWFNHRNSSDYENTGVTQIAQLSELVELLD